MIASAIMLQSRRQLIRMPFAGLVAALTRGVWREPAGAIVQDGTRSGDLRTVEGLAMRWCPPGRFRMGSPAAEVGRRTDEDIVDVTLTRGFWIGQFEVTQQQWLQVMGNFADRAPSDQHGRGARYPVYWVSFEHAVRFCEALTTKARERGALSDTQRFSLPTEAQWEYACRAGSTTAYSIGSSITPSDANFDPDADARPSPLRGGSKAVGGYRANAWGIYDMHGNVWEWCLDYYHAKLPGGTDPDLSTQRGVRNGDGSYSRVRRGGAWIEAAWACRAACRLRYEPHRSSDHIGFRVVIVQGS